MTLSAYQTLYESATGYGLRKALFTKKDEFETNDRRGELQKQIENGQKEVAELKGKCTFGPIIVCLKITITGVVS